MTLTVKYDRLDFFGNRIYTEDSTEYADKKKIQKAFTFLSKEKCIAVEIGDNESDVYFWDTVQDFENRILTMRHYKAWNSSIETKVAFDKAKKAIYEKIGG